MRQEQRIIFSAPLKDDHVEKFEQPGDEVADQRFRSAGRRVGRSQSTQLLSSPRVQAPAVNHCGSEGIRQHDDEIRLDAMKYVLRKHDPRTCEYGVTRWRMCGMHGSEISQRMA